MPSRNIHIKSFGCQMNKLDTSLAAAALEQAGFAIVDDVKTADAVLINTCSVRRHAEQRVLSHLGHLKFIKRSRPELVVAVMGCMAQRLGAELLAQDAVDIVCGPAQLPKLPQILSEMLDSRSAGARQKTLIVTEQIRRKPEPADARGLDDFEFAYDRPDPATPGQAYVRVMRGCDKFCSYCVVPYVRGPEISRKPQEIVEQVKKLAGAGVRQVTLLGQTVNSYFWQAGEKTYGLADLLEMVSQVDGVRWIRFITSYPADFDESILHAMADLPKVAPYLHIPAQSGSDRILAAMNRRYTAGQYLDLLAKAREIVRDIAIAGDFIVGFPGETDADFAETARLVREARYKNCFIFKYSPRPGTRADGKLADDVPMEVKKRRNIELLDVQNEISERENQKFVGRTVEVFAEGPSRKGHLDAKDDSDARETGQLVGRTAADYIVVFDGPAELAGEFVKVRIERASGLTLFGKLL